jgi:hypothetical protein
VPSSVTVVRGVVVRALEAHRELAAALEHKVAVVVGRLDHDGDVGADARALDAGVELRERAAQRRVDRRAEAVRLLADLEAVALGRQRAAEVVGRLERRADGAALGRLAVGARLEQAPAQVGADRVRGEQRRVAHVGRGGRGAVVVVVVADAVRLRVAADAAVVVVLVQHRAAAAGVEAQLARLRRRARNAAEQVVDRRLARRHAGVVDVDGVKLLGPVAQNEVVAARVAAKLAARRQVRLRLRQQAGDGRQHALGRAAKRRLLRHVADRLRVERHVDRVRVGPRRERHRVRAVVVVGDLDRRRGAARVEQRRHERVAAARLVVAEPVDRLHAERRQLVRRAAKERAPKRKRLVGRRRQPPGRVAAEVAHAHRQAVVEPLLLAERLRVDEPLLGHVDAVLEQLLAVLGADPERAGEQRAAAKRFDESEAVGRAALGASELLELPRTLAHQHARRRHFDRRLHAERHRHVVLVALFVAQPRANLRGEEIREERRKKQFFIDDKKEKKKKRKKKKKSFFLFARNVARKTHRFRFAERAARAPRELGAGGKRHRRARRFARLQRTRGAGLRGTGAPVHAAQQHACRYECENGTHWRERGRG